MAEISWTRRSYEAGVLLIPLEREARSWTGAHADALAGITVAGEALLPAQRRFEPEPVPESGEGRAVSSPLDHAMHGADVVVLFTLDLGAVDREAVTQLGDAARLSGTLLGTIVVSPGARWERPDAHGAMTSIREAADNVVILKDDGFVLAFLHVLRGGPQENARDGLAGVAP
ncbi:hypothetical protein BAY61_17905 [Prauserella marina]|uniref:Uncharacterized protein n=1 Tax=Prauserella marina TaxID=530584 RepID=A0A222VS52_9PSEU|nr:hypothetical protein [Prauserella marina]ASR36563.1 hypothetical protein BAY61_17905 [Prauserella marina]PWV73967.1 hypothetical protein DES30_108140 [Prauserella marina]SDD59975.1 hypothetical protein SAMN05421630_110140 [Prauserella marina]